MPDPSARYGAPLERKSGGNANPLNLLNQLLRGNKQSQAVAGLPGNLKTAKTRSKSRTSTDTTNPLLNDLGGLEQMAGAFGGVSPADISQLQAELRKAIAGQFDPQISGINKDIAGAKNRAGKAKKDIGAIYDDLVGYYEGQVKPTKARGKAAKQEAANNSAGLQQSISDDYASRIREQVDEYKRLGIQSAQPSATEGQNADLANSLAVAQNTNAAETAALNQQGAADLAYWTEGAGISKREGAEQQAGITEQLNGYLNDQSKQLELLKGQKSSAYHAGLMELQQQAAQAASQAQNQQWDRMLDLAKLKLSMANSGGSGGSSNPGTGLTGAMSFLKDSGNASLGTTFQNYLMESQRWANTPQAKQMYGGSVDTPEEWAQVMRDNALNQKLGGGAPDALFQAMLRYMGRR